MEGFGSSNRTEIKRKDAKKGAKLLESAIKAHKTGDIGNAETLYKRAIDTGFKHEIAYSNLGIIYKDTGRIKEAISIYEQAIDATNFANGYLNIGSIFAELGDFTRALKAHLIKSNPIIQTLY